MISDGLYGQRNAAQGTVNDKLLADHSLKIRDDHATAAGFGQPNHQNQAVTWHDDVTESSTVDPSETDHFSTKQVILLGEKTGQLGDRFELKIFWFFQAQGLLSVLFSLPALVA